MKIERKMLGRRPPARVLKVTLGPYLVLLAIVGSYLCRTGWNNSTDLTSRLLPLNQNLAEISQLDRSLALDLRLILAPGGGAARDEFEETAKRLDQLIDAAQTALNRAPRGSAAGDAENLRVAHGSVGRTERLIAALVADGRADQAASLLDDPPYLTARGLWESRLAAALLSARRAVAKNLDDTRVMSIQGAILLSSILLSLSVIWVWGLVSIQHYHGVRNSAEEALRTSEERFRALVENIPVGVYRIQPGRVGGFVAANPAMIRMFGCDSLEDFLATDPRRLYADDRKRADFSERLKREGRVVGAELPLKRKDGTVLWGLISANLIRSADGAILYVDGIAEDVSERKAATEALQRSERLHRLLAENIRDVILTIDMAMGITYVSPSVSLLTGYAPEDMISKNVGEFLTSGSIDRARKALTANAADPAQSAEDAASDATHARVLELELLRKDGSTIWAEMRASFLRDEVGQPIGAQASLRDITVRRRAETALRESEDLYRGIIETADEGVWITNAEGWTLFVNTKMASMLGYAVDEMLDRDAMELVEAAGDGADSAETFGSRDRRPRHDLKLRRKDGAVFWASVSHSPMIDPDGNYRGSLRMINDITDRKRAEEGSRILAAVSSLFLSGKDINLAIQTVLEMCGRFDNADRAHVFHRSADSRLVTNLHEWCEAGVPSQLANRRNIPVEDFESLLDRLAAGESVGVPNVEAMPESRLRGILLAQQTASIILFPIFINGEFEGFCGFETVRSRREWSASDASVLRQISDLISRGVERKRAEEALKSSESLFTSLVEHLTQSVYRKDTRGRYTFANSRFGELLARKPEAILGFTDTELFPRDLAERYADDDARVLAGDVLEDVEERPLPNGDTRFLHVVKTPVRAPSGEIVGIQGITWDVTERRRAEEAVRAASRLEATATLAGGIAHDFNNLMVSILGNSDLLRMEAGSLPNSVRRLEVISASAKRGGELAQKLLAFARGGKAQRYPINLKDVIVEALELQARAIPAKIKIETRIDADLRDTAADPAQMTQVVMNLCLNAAEAIEEEGTIVISARNFQVDEAFALAHRGLKPGPHLCLTVQDSGVGMPPEVRARVFEPFFTTKFQGRGLGLAAVHGIVRNHAGHIAVDSEPGHGSAFRVYLPAIAPKRNEAVETPIPRPKPAPAAATVLIVDDDETVRTVTRAMLERLGHQSIAVESAREAVALLRSDPRRIDVIILDLCMKEMDGAEAFPLLRLARPEAQIIICSGYERDEVSDELIRQGARAFLNKPFRIDSLGAEVRAALAAGSAASDPAPAAATGAPDSTTP